MRGGRGGNGAAYQEAGAEPGAGLALREGRLRGVPRRLVGAERVGEDRVHGRHVAGGEGHAVPRPAAATDGEGGGGGGGDWEGMIGEEGRSRGVASGRREERVRKKAGPPGRPKTSTLL